jgi:hypothetical protein
MTFITHDIIYVGISSILFLLCLTSLQSLYHSITLITAQILKCIIQSTTFLSKLTSLPFDRTSLNSHFIYSFFSPIKFKTFQF